jgi:hypothetical protein
MYAAVRETLFQIGSEQNQCHELAMAYRQMIEAILIINRAMLL